MKVIKIFFIIILSIGVIRALLDFIGRMILSSDNSSYSIGYSIGTSYKEIFYEYL